MRSPAALRTTPRGPSRGGVTADRDPQTWVPAGRGRSRARPVTGPRSVRTRGMRGGPPGAAAPGGNGPPMIPARR